MSGRPATGAWRPEPSPDRRRVGVVGLLLIAALVALSLWSAMTVALVSLPQGPAVSLQASVVVAALSVLGLPSLPLRWVVRSVAAVGAGIVIAYGSLGAGGGVAGALPVLAWLAATVGALALCPTGSAVVDRDRPPERVEGRCPVARPGTAATVAAVVVGVLAVSLLLGGPAARLPSGTTSLGDRPDGLGLDPLAPINAPEQLDMTRRPRLSDAVVMTVRSDVVSFWRTAVYDRWDGATWTGTGADASRLVGPDGGLVPGPDDLAALIGERSTQEFRLEARAAGTLPVAPSPAELEGAGAVLQSTDGTLVSLDGLGRGATYRVVSRQVPSDPTTLRAAGDDVPAAVRRRYAAPTVATERVRALARRLTAGSGNDYDRVQAVVGWMDANTRYSLDAPLSPPGDDVVDHFLFESRLGWCEQIASSLVVMLRSVGVPARLATGYVPGEWEQLGGRFVVRERDAHAWAEVWFPGAGWVAFDPTADVPLAGEEGADARSLPVGAGSLGLLLAAVAVAAVGTRPLLAAARRAGAARSRRAARRRAVRQRWDVAAEVALEDLGRRAGRPRGDADTVAAHAAALADALGDPRLEQVGRVVDRARYGTGPVEGGDRRLVEEVLAAAGQPAAAPRP